jgi:hypothetical protein
MNYNKQQINGDAAEYFVAYTLTKVLGWPCRLFGVDLGVDAELEVVDALGVSQGDIIKVQIKAKETTVPTRELAVTVEPRHIEYWKHFCLPVIVCCADLADEKVYWKQITSTEAFRTRGASNKVSFDREADLFGPASKQALERLVNPAESKNIEALFSELEARFALLPVGYVRFGDLDTIAAVDEQCGAVQEVLERLSRILAFFPWRLSSYAHARMAEIADRVSALRNDANWHAADC